MSLAFSLSRETAYLLGGVGALLVIASLIGFVLSKRTSTDAGRATIANLNARIRAWWMMVAVFGAAVATGVIGATVLFALLSFLALREFVTLTPTRRGDHMALSWIFFIVVPFQYLLVAIQWYGLFSIFIPVWAFLFLPARIAVSGDPERFLERAAKIQFALMICVYCVSHVPALLMLDLKGYTNNAGLLLFLVIVVQMSDVLQYVWGKLFGRHKVAPTISPSKTWEGLIGGVLSATALGAGLWWITPFTPLQAAGMSLLITILGFAGGLTMSAIKRDSGVKDFGALIEGHGGVLDRIDSLCFAGPVFFHVTRFYFG
ncbi:MAG: phosphatidate cytidylyltransferase [Thermoanaerobaculia bacterium]|nr:phosphatidate cytidylyltransferase [Thermoanaerobaculia bacterium]